MMDLITQGHNGVIAHPETVVRSSYEHAEQIPLQEEDDILSRLRRRKLSFFLVFISVLTAVGLSYFALPRVYKAETLLTVAPPDQVLASENAPGGQDLTVGDTADLESQSIVLVSPKTLRGALSQDDVRAALLLECSATKSPIWKAEFSRLIGKTADVPCQAQVADLSAMVDSLRGRTLVSVSGRSRILTLSFSSPIPEVAQTIANAIVENYLATQRAEKLRPRDEALTWLRSQIVDVTSRLQLTETAIESSLHRNGVIRGQSGPVAAEQLTSVAQQLATAQSERAAATGRLREAQINGSATSDVLGNRTVNEDKQQLSAINSQIAQLSARFGSAYPVIADLEQQRHALEKAVSQDTATVNQSTMADYQSANSRILTLLQDLNKLKGEVRLNDEATTQVASLQRTLASNQELYIDLNKSLSQLETSRRLATSNVRLISLAELPKAVAFPKITSFTLTGIVLATAMATVAALLKDRSDGTVRSIKSLQTAAGMRVLARVPHVAGMGKGALRMYGRMMRPSAFQEAIRSLYAECFLVDSRLIGVRQKPRTILVTSSRQGEGKTFLTLALAQFAALAGRRVIILECDLRQPSLARGLALSSNWGISEILRGQVAPDEVITASSIAGLDIIPAGQAVSNSVELLASPRYLQLLAWAATRYDIILVDSPPSQVLSDAKVMASSVDGVLYCTRWGASDLDCVVQGQQQIREVGGQILGLILNDYNPSSYALYEKRVQSESAYLALK